MNPSLLKKMVRPLVAWTAVAVLCAGVTLAQDGASPAGQAQGQPAAPQGPRADGQIEMDVVHALDASAALKNDLITAATIQGEVTLSGTVSTEASKRLAESIAAHVNGVTKVNNNLKVGNPAADAQTSQPAPDTQEMPDPDQSQAQQQMAGLPPPGPAPDQGASPTPNESQAPAQAPYPQQQGAYPPPPPQRPQYQNPQYSQYPPQYPQAPQAPRYAPATGPVILPAGTLLQLRTSEPVDSKRAKDGEPVQFMVIQDVTMGGVLAIPRGAVVHGVVSEHKNVGSGSMGGSSSLTLTLTSLDLGGRNYPLQSDQFKVKAPNKAGQTVGSALTGGVIGTIIGCAVGRGEGCAIGAGAGVAGGTALGAAEPGYRAWIPAEALVTFHLAAPVTVVPVGPQEAARLAQGLYPGGPALYRRAPYGSPYYGYGYGPGYYAYPPPYYRPYFIVGGAYYWR
jgi:BON domain-containing protein